MNKLTPAQKAKRTKLERKYFAERDAAIESAHEDLHSFCRTLYPERNAKIDAAEAKMEQIIADARAEFEETRLRVMDEFDNNPEVVRLHKIYDDIFNAATKVLSEKIEAIEI